MENKKKKILLAEDDKFIARAYKDGLEQAGFEVVVAHDGVEALEKIKSEMPDLVLLDLIMPRKNGFEVLEQAKNAGFKVDIVILSNLGQDSDIQKAEELGAIDYLVKSNFSMKGIIKKVQEYLN